MNAETLPALAGQVEPSVRPLVAWVTEGGCEVLQAGDGPARAMPMQDEETGFTVPLYSSAALRGMEDALQRINDWCCYATEEDVNARLLALQQIGQTAREALAQVDSAAWVELHRDAWNDGRAMLAASDAEREARVLPLTLRDVSACRPLTDDQIDALAMDEDGLPNSHLELARAVELAHGIGA